MSKSRLVGEQKLKDLAQVALSASGGDQTEVVITTVDHGLTRFANSEIHQNTHFADGSVNVRVVVGKKIGVSSTNRLLPQAIKATARRAYELARLQKENPHFVSLPQAVPTRQAPHGFGEASAAHTPAQKSSALKTLFQQAKAAQASLSGAFETDVSELAVANSLGVWAYHPSTSAKLSVTATGQAGTGYASSYHVDVTDIVPDEVGRTALDKAVRAQHPQGVEPGDYEVVLEPTAVNDLLDYFAWLGPNARIYHEDVSFITGKLGQKILSEHITIHEDALHPQTLPLPFDFEGVPKKRITLFERGVAKGIVYDSYHAHRFGTENTGHALPAPSTEGAIAGHLVFESGTHTLATMIDSVKRGLLVTRFWYVNALHFKQLMLTGMTRDGTFLIENGTIVGPVKNMRFTQSVVEALRDVEMVGDTLTAQRSWLGANLVPALKMKRFHFSGRTEH